MAIRLVTVPTAEGSGTIPKGGGSISISFIAQASKATFLQQTCTIRPETPYVFANPQDPANARVHVGDIEPVSVVQRRFRLALELVRDGDGADVLQALMDLAIQETTPTGRTRRIGRQPVAPVELPIVITIE
jgi:hypothetical protein